jgi:hypothetical protein
VEKVLFFLDWYGFDQILSALVTVCTDFWKAHAQRMPACSVFDLAHSFVVGLPGKMRASDPGIGAVELLPDAIKAEIDVGSVVFFLGIGVLWFVDVYKKRNE